ncbi:MAG: serine acetyltransferase [Negativicutes bacterium]
MKLSMGQDELRDYVICQLRTFFPDKNSNINELGRFWDTTLQRIEYCFSKVNSKYFWDGNNVFFNHLNADQYAMFLYFLSNTLYRNNSDATLCTKIYQLNRYLHSIDVYYEVELPEIFLFVHSIGTVLGRAQYSNYFIAYQRCNVGGSISKENLLIYPEMHEHVTLHPGTSVLGQCIVGRNSTIAAGSLLLNRNLDQNSLYIGNPRDYIIKNRETPHYAWKKETEGDAYDGIAEN